MFVNQNDCHLTLDFTNIQPNLLSNWRHGRNPISLNSTPFFILSFSSCQKKINTVVRGLITLHVYLNSLSAHHTASAEEGGLTCFRCFFIVFPALLFYEVYVYLGICVSCVWVCVSSWVMSLIEAPGGVFLSPQLWQGLFSCISTLLWGQMQVAVIKAELLTPFPKNEMAHCVATDSRHNEP